MSNDSKIILAFPVTAAGWDSVDLVGQPRSLLVRWPRGDIFVDQGIGPYRVRNRTIQLDRIRRFVADRPHSFDVGPSYPIRLVLEHDVAGRVWTLDVGSTPSPDVHGFADDQCHQIAAEALEWTARINAHIVDWQNIPLVLVVEDRDEVRDQLKELVHAEGLKSQEATTVNEAVQKAHDKVPNMILLDLELPREPHGEPIVRGGLEVVNEIDDVRQKYKIPIAIVTKQELSTVRQDAYRLGLQDRDLFNKDPASLMRVSKWLRDHS